MVQVYQTIARVAQTDSSVLLQGESGTGKELIARAIHASGPRSSGPFVTVDGGALADSLLSQSCSARTWLLHRGDLFPKGLLEQAHSGTCFLDRWLICRRHLQDKLLRVLQGRKFAVCRRHRHDGVRCPNHCGL